MELEESVIAGSDGNRRRKLRGDPIKDSVPYMLQVAARLQTTCFMSTLVGTNVHPAESYVVHELWKMSPLSQTELSARLAIGHATIGKTLKRLEKNGFVQRSRLPDDARRVMVRLTDKGVEAHDRFEAAATALIAEIDEVLGAAEARRLLNGLNRLADHFSDRQDQEGLDAE